MNRVRRGRGGGESKRGRHKHLGNKPKLGENTQIGILRRQVRRLESEKRSKCVYRRSTLFRRRSNSKRKQIYKDEDDTKLVRSRVTTNFLDLQNFTDSCPILVEGRSRKLYRTFRKEHLMQQLATQYKPKKTQQERHRERQNPS